MLVLYVARGPLIRPETWLVAGRGGRDNSVGEGEGGRGIGSKGQGGSAR